MSSLFNVFDIAGSALSAQSLRLNTTASNLANADSVAGSEEKTYKARQPVFAASLDMVSQDLFGDNVDTPGVKVLGIVESDAPLKMDYQPNHPKANEAGYIYKPNVNLMEEMANMISASRSYQVNVDVMESAKTLMQKTLNLGQ